MRLFELNAATGLAATIRFEDLEARQVLKSRGWRWNPTCRQWEKQLGDKDTLKAEALALAAHGFKVFSKAYARDLAEYLKVDVAAIPVGNVTVRTN